MTCVFISHSSLDRAAVEREIISPLRAHGIDLWYSTENIGTTSEWERQIHNGLTKCDWFLVVLSPRSIESEWVRREVHWAVKKRNGKIVPVMLETCEPEDLHLGLGPLQYVDFRDLQGLLAVWGLDKASQVKRLYNDAKDLIAKEDWASAMEKLEAALRLDPKHLQSRAELKGVRQQEYLASTYEDGTTALRQRRWREAFKTLQHLRGIDSDYKDVNKLITLAEVQLEKEEAKRLFDEGSEAAKRNDWTKAVELFQAVLKITPSHDLAQFGLVEALQQMELAKLYAEGRSHMEAGRWEAALEQFRRVRSIDRGYKGVSEQIADADAALAEATERRSKKEALERESRVKADRQQEVQNREAVKTRVGSEAKVLEKSQKAAPPLVARTIHFQSRNKLFTTLKILAVIIGLSVVIWPSFYVVRRIHASWLNSKGDELFAQQKYADAEVEYRKAVEINPNEVDYHSDLGQALSQLQRHGEAEVECRKAVELKPNDLTYQDRLASNLYTQSKFKEAEAEYRKCVELNPKNAAFYDRVGASLYMQGKPKEAEIEYRKAIELGPDFAGYHYNLGLSLRFQDRHEEEAAEYRRALEIDPNHEGAKNALKLK